jgi:hypothetical protein
MKQKFELVVDEHMLNIPQVVPNSNKNVEEKKEKSDDKKKKEEKPVNKPVEKVPEKVVPKQQEKVEVKTEEPPRVNKWKDGYNEVQIEIQKMLEHIQQNEILNKKDEEELETFDGLVQEYQKIVKHSYDILFLA